MFPGESRAHLGEIFRQAIQLTEANPLRPKVDRRNFTLDIGLLADEALEQGTALIKIAVDIQ